MLCHVCFVKPAKTIIYSIRWKCYHNITERQECILLCLPVPSYVDFIIEGTIWILLCSNFQWPLRKKITRHVVLNSLYGASSKLSQPESYPLFRTLPLAPGRGAYSRLPAIRKLSFSLVSLWWLGADLNPPRRTTRHLSTIWRWDRRITWPVTHRERESTQGCFPGGRR